MQASLQGLHTGTPLCFNELTMNEGKYPRFIITSLASPYLHLGNAVVRAHMENQ